MKQLKWVLVGGVLLVARTPSGAEEAGLAAGQRAPRFALTTLDGGEKLRSRKVFAASDLTVLILWDSYCPDCLKAVVECGAYAPRADSLGVGMVSINFDHEEMVAVRAFVKGAALPFPVLWDSRQQVARAYQAHTYDFSLFLVDGKGMIRYAHYDHPPELLELLARQVDEIRTAQAAAAAAEAP